MITHVTDHLPDGIIIAKIFSGDPFGNHDGKGIVNTSINITLNAG